MIQLPALNSFHAVDTTELILSGEKDLKRRGFSQLIKKKKMLNAQLLKRETEWGKLCHFVLKLSSMHGEINMANYSYLYQFIFQDICYHLK